jgi:hypothetical protein
MDECRISDLASEVLDLDPWGVCAPPGTLDMPQMIPLMESTAIGLKTIVLPNEELGRKGFLGSVLMLCLQPQMYYWKSCALNGWMMRSARFHHQNLMINGSIEAPVRIYKMMCSFYHDDTLVSQPQAEASLRAP